MSLQDFRFSSFFPQKDGVLVIRERLLHPKFGIKWMNFLDISSSKMASCQPWEGLSSRETDKQLVYIRDDGNRKMDTEKRIIKKKPSKLRILKDVCWKHPVLPKTINVQISKPQKTFSGNFCPFFWFDGHLPCRKLGHNFHTERLCEIQDQEWELQTREATNLRRILLVSAGGLGPGGWVPPRYPIPFHKGI